MQPYEQNPYAYGTGFARSAAQVDQGLRSFMLGVYNNMVLGLGVSALVALGINMAATSSTPTPVRIGSVYLTEFGRLLYGTPLMWVVALAPLAFIFFMSFRAERMSAASVRTSFFAFAAVMGASPSTLLVVFKLGSIVQVFFITAAAFGALSL